MLHHEIVLRPFVVNRISERSDNDIANFLSTLFAVGCCDRKTKLLDRRGSDYKFAALFFNRFIRGIAGRNGNELYFECANLFAIPVVFYHDVASVGGIDGIRIVS